MLRCTANAALLAVLLAGFAPYARPADSGPAAVLAQDATIPVPPVPPRIAQGPDYEHCLDMLYADPQGASAFADTWAANGGGDGALHCRALAQIALGNVETGAELLEQLADHSTAAGLARAAIYGQAVQAWLLDDEPRHAFDAATRALSLDPDDADLLTDRAVAAGNLGMFPIVIDDLNRVLTIDPRRIEALVLRGSAYRHLDQFDRAGEDIGRALILDPDDAEALLERGILRQRNGDIDGARADWRRAVSLAPDSNTADLAQQNLALLEAGPKE
jgi:tetratricopeptide (TPR) repeat protein